MSERVALKIGDPVMDAAQGRPMVVVATPGETVAAWSEANDYDLTENYGNAKFDPTEDEPVVEAVYVSDVRSEPSKSYTFPRSRLRLIDAHHADDGRRLYDRVVLDVLFAMFRTCDEPAQRYLEEILKGPGLPDPEGELVDEAMELAEVERVIGGGDGGE